MEYHINGKPEDIARYVLCPGSQSRAALIAERFDNRYTVSDDRGIVVYSGEYRGVHMTACGTGMGGPALAIATEELSHLGADTFIRIGSCGAFQPNIQPGDILVANGAIRGGGTGQAYLPIEFPSVPTFEVSRLLVETAERLGISVKVGVGYSSDAFYSTAEEANFKRLMKGRPLFIEMESDTLFVIGAVRGWRTGAIFVSDGTVDDIKPEWGQAAFLAGVNHAIQISLDTLLAVASRDDQV